jgi:hypothetical protein
MAGTQQGSAGSQSPRQETDMFINPQISKQLADEHRRDLLADARQQRFVRQVKAESGTARRRQPLTDRLWRRLRPAGSPRLEPQA